MSDLAPFVAAVLRDRTVTELKKENDELRQKVDQFVKVQVTGPKGTPIYYEGSLKNGYDTPTGTGYWIDLCHCDDVSSLEYRIDNGVEGGVYLNDIKTFEVRLGGLVMGTWRVGHTEHDEEDIYRCHGPGAYDRDDCDWNSSVRFGCVVSNKLVIMKQIMFRKKNISSILSLALRN